MLFEIPSVFHETSFSEYLKKYVVAFKTIFGPEEFKQWILRSGISSRITFQKYLKQKRAIPGRTQQKLFVNLDFSTVESDSFSQTRSANQSMVKADTYAAPEIFFASPLNTIVLNLCGLNAVMTEEKILSILNTCFSVTQIDESIHFLLNSKLIEKNTSGILKRCFEGSITTLPGAKSTASREYFKDVYRLADQAWKLPLADRELNAFTFRMNQKDLPKVKALVRNFRHQLGQFHLKETGADSVYQCAVAVIPVFCE